MPPNSTRKAVAGTKRNRVQDADTDANDKPAMRSSGDETVADTPEDGIEREGTTERRLKPISRQPQNGFTPVNGHDSQRQLKSEDFGLILRPRKAARLHGSFTPANQHDPKPSQDAVVEAEVNEDEAREARPRAAQVAAGKEKAERRKREAELEHYDPENPPWPVLYWAKSYVVWFKLKLLEPDIDRNRRVDAIMLRIRAEAVGEHVPDRSLDVLRFKLKAMSLRNAQPYQPHTQPMASILCSPLDREPERLRRMYPDRNVEGEDIWDLLDREQSLRKGMHEQQHLPDS